VSRLVLAVLLATVSTAVGCGKSNAAPAIPAPEVEVATVVQKDVPIFSEWVATLDGYVNAQIQPQVTGYIIRQSYKEGSFVRKGQIALLAAGFPRVYLFRPAYIYPVEPRKEPNFNYRLIRAIYPVFRVLFPNQVIRVDDLARAMVDIVLRKTQERQGVVFENRDIRSMVESRTPLTNRAV
jgi:hypothetical protein